MELAIKQITILILVVLVLVVVSIFVTSQSATQIQNSDANRVFNEKCLDYKSAYDCSYQAIDASPGGFTDFVNACRTLYGSERDAYSCLTLYCTACNSGVLTQNNLAQSISCAATCERCTGSAQAGAVHDKSLCCSQYAASCSSVGTCGVC